MDKAQIEVLKQLVHAAGAVWVGIQEGEGAYEDLVLFNSPTTHTTLALPVHACTESAIRNRLAASNLNFGKENA